MNIFKLNTKQILKVNAWVPVIGARYIEMPDPGELKPGDTANVLNINGQIIGTITLAQAFSL